jgi:hypothetical protein
MTTMMLGFSTVASPRIGGTAFAARVKPAIFKKSRRCIEISPLS